MKNNVKNKMKSGSTLALALAAVMAFSVPALADDAMSGDTDTSATATAPAAATDAAPAEKVVSFAVLDADKNGAVSQEEFKKSGLSDDEFTTLDTDKNGSLSEEELKAYKPAPTSGE